MSEQVPFAYLLPDYDCPTVHQTLKAVVACLKKYNFDAQFCVDIGITAYYPDGTEKIVGFHEYIDVVDVDEKAVAFHIDLLRSKSYEEEMVRIKMHKSGDPYVFVSGSAPIHDLNRDNLIQREINRLKYQWKADL